MRFFGFALEIHSVKVIEVSFVRFLMILLICCDVELFGGEKQ